MTYTVFTREKHTGKIEIVHSGLPMEHARDLCQKHNVGGDCVLHRMIATACDCPWWEFTTDERFKGMRKGARP